MSVSSTGSFQSTGAPLRVSDHLSTSQSLTPHFTAHCVMLNGGYSIPSMLVSPSIKEGK